MTDADSKLRAAPHARDAEEAILGLMLENPAEVVPQVLSLHDDFYLPANRILFQAIMELVDHGQNFSLLELSDHLMKSGEMEKAGGPSAVADLTLFRDVGIPLALLPDYINQVRHAKQLRNVIDICVKATRTAYTTKLCDAEALQDEVEEQILALRENASEAEGPVPYKAIVLNAISQMEERRKSGESLGLSTGFEDLDRLTRGLVRAEFWVVAARPSMGKTTIGMQIAREVAKAYHVLVFSAEMVKERLAMRSMAAPMKVENRRLAEGKLNREEFNRLGAVVNSEAQLKLWIDDEPNIRVTDLRARARRLNRDVDVRLVFIDYLQLLKSGNNERDREREVSAMSSSLKALGKELNATIIVAAQLNRKVEDRKGGRPKKSDLRESGSIEQDADVVGLICKATGDDDDDDEAGETVVDATFIVDKCRDGATGDVDLTFHKDLSYFAPRLNSGRRRL